MRRILTDERIRARDLFVLEGWACIDIAPEIGVHEDTVRKWSKQDNWLAQRSEVLSSPMEISGDIKKILANFVTDLKNKVANGEFIADSQIDRVKKLVSAVAGMDGKSDQRAAALYTMKKFSAFCSRTNETVILKELPRVLANFYRSLAEDE